LGRLLKLQFLKKNAIKIIFVKNAPQTLIIVKEEKTPCKTMQDLGTIEIGLILKILTSKGNNP